MARPYQGYYNAAGDKLPGTTTICGIAKESGGLVQWAYKQGREHERLVAQGRPAPSHLHDVVDRAANIGTLAHECCEADIKGTDQPAIPDDMRDQVMMAYAQYLMWKKQTRLVIVASEVALVSERYQFGGTLDFVCEIEGQLCLGDFKTSSAVYPEMLLQLAAYRELWNENKPETPITGPSHLLRISKENADFAHHSYGDLSEAWTMFLHLRAVHDLRAKLKKRAA
jgi:hypothetical protein